MNNYQVSTPEKFNCKQPADWPKWIRRFERFRIASNLHEQPEENQVNTLVYTMGDEADDILTSLCLSTDDKKVYNTVKQKFESHFVKRRNVIFERAKFNRRRQEEGESIDSYITSLYSLVEHCGYGPLTNEMIRDKIVVGIKDAHLSEKLQMDSELTLDKVTNLTRQSEQVKHQQTLLKSNFDLSSSSTNVDIVRSKRSSTRVTKGSNKPKHFGTQNSSQYNANKRENQAYKCTRCGRTPNHAFKDCPARDATCHKCAKQGHYAKLCRSKSNKVAMIREQYDSDSENDQIFLGSVHSGSQPWSVKLTLGNEPMKFKIDTGADVTAIPAKLYDSLNLPPLTVSKKTLYGAGNTTLKVRGKFKGKLSTSTKETTEEIYVVKGLHAALLGRPAISSLNIIEIAHIDTISSQKQCKAKFPKLYKGLGKLKEEYRIKLDPHAEPYATTVPRRIPLPLIPKVKEELQRMEAIGVISPVTEPTDWCAGMVVVPKPNGSVRICVDLTKLNKSVKTEKLILPSVGETLGKLSGAKVFTKLDANSGFWQVPLSQDSSLLTTFITPLGRYRFNRLPFGINSATEHFQRRIMQILDDCKGVVSHVDDMLIFGATQEEHDVHTTEVLRRLENAGITLNEKCEFSKRSVKFLGHIIDETGVRADPDKIAAVANMPRPTNVSEIRSFMGMVNQLGKFSPNLAELTKPLRDLLKGVSAWYWGDSQEQAFEKVKQELTNPPVLQLYDTKAETLISADASSYGIGAVIVQKQNDNWQPIAYASRSLTPTEQRYAQIEKEALASTWACERFQQYVVGKHFKLETDHKPLVSLLGNKDLEDLPPRIQRFRMRLMRFDYTISHVPGKQLLTADVLSRTPNKDDKSNDTTLQQEVEAYISAITDNSPSSDKFKTRLRTGILNDEVCLKIIEYVQNGWPQDKDSLSDILKPFWQHQSDITMNKGLLLKGNRLIIPTSLRLEILDKIHAGHQGIVKCRERIKCSVWWPGISKQIQTLVENCATCIRETVNKVEPLIPTKLPERPWQKVATDLFEYKKAQYLLVVDYFSRFIEVAKLSTTTSLDVITHLKSIFSRHGIPSEIVSDNGPQFSSHEFAQFANDWNFHHQTSSPKYPQSNGEAERAVKTIKRLLSKCPDPYLALLTYRSTPLENGYSPSELLMGRRIRSTLPQADTLLTPNWPNFNMLESKENSQRRKMKYSFDQRHQAKPLRELCEGDSVWLKDMNTQGTIVKRENTPRSYTVQTPNRQYRRNRKHLSYSPHPIEIIDNDSDEHDEFEIDHDSNETRNVIPSPMNIRNPTCAPPITTRSGRQIKPVQKFDL